MKPVSEELSEEELYALYLFEHIPVDIQERLLELMKSIVGEV